MENYPYLFCWNIDKYPYLVPSIAFIEKNIMLKNDKLEASTVWYELIYVLNGTAELSLENTRAPNSFSKTAETGDFFFLPIKVNYKIEAISKSFEFLHIKALFYTCVTPHQSPTLNHIQILSGSTPNVSLGIRLPYYLPILENSEPYFLLQKIRADCKSITPGHNIKLQCHLTELLIELMHQSADNYNNILEYANLIGISSKYSLNTILPEGCKLTVSDVKIWSDNPNTKKNAKLLSVFKATSYYDLQVEPNSLSITEIDSEMSEFGDKNLKITALSDTPYHIWLYPSEIRTFDIRDYRETAYLQFFAHSNMVVSVGIVVYNHNIHQCINRNFQIPSDRGMQEFCVPILGEADDNRLSSYVHQTIEYIEQHYKEKISLDDVAELVHLNPSYLSKIFSRETGSTISEYTKNHRLSIAKKLLRMTDKPIDEIAIQTGFYDTSHFTKVFSATAGISPNAYRKSKAAK